MKIIDLNDDSGNLINEVAQIVLDDFEGISWPDFPSALAEVAESFKERRISRVAIDDDCALGWIGGIEQYNGHVWEMHPLVVKPSEQRRGIGAALVADFEQCVLARGGETVMLGADNETNSTSLGGVDLYPDVTQYIRTIKTHKSHQFEFYQKQGYVIVGVIPSRQRRIPGYELTRKVIVRPVEAKDRDAWDGLYQGYAKYYKVTQTAEMRDCVWSWLHDPEAECEGLIAEGLNGNVIGLTHFRPFARPLTATTGGFLDDLFVLPDSRGLGAADALIDGVKNVAVERGWSVVRWITAEDNYRGRSVYDRVATRTNWVTYDIKL